MRRRENWPEDEHVGEVVPAVTHLSDKKLCNIPKNSLRVYVDRDRNGVIKVDFLYRASDRRSETMVEFVSSRRTF